MFFSSIESSLQRSVVTVKRMCLRKGLCIARISASSVMKRLHSVGFVERGHSSRGGTVHRA